MTNPEHGQRSSVGDAPKHLPQNRTHRLNNQDEMYRILREGSDDDLEGLREFHGWTPENVARFRHYERMREEASADAHQRVTSRELFGPAPTEEELGYGDYFDTVESEARDAVPLLRRKGYAVNRASLADPDGTFVLQVGVPDLTVTPELREHIDALRKDGIQVDILPEKIVIKDERLSSLARLKDVCDSVAALLPDLGKDAPPSTRRDAKAFLKAADSPRAFVESPMDIEAILADARSRAETDADALSDAQREAIAWIEGLPMHVAGKEDVALVVGGLKPSTGFHLPREHGVVADEMLSRLRALGLHAAVGERAADQKSEDEYLVARDAETLARLQRASAAENDREYGELMGFPDTAIDGYVHGTLLRSGPRDIVPEVTVGMRLSQGHWPEELRHAARWNAFLRKASSTLGRR